MPSSGWAFRIGKNYPIYTLNFSTEPFLIEIGNHVGIAAGTQFVTHKPSIQEALQGKFINFNCLERDITDLLLKSDLAVLASAKSAIGLTDDEENPAENEN